MLGDGQCKSARDVIIRELVCNCLIHCEFISPHIARITIDNEGVRRRDASCALYAGSVTLESVDLTPKNPIIANFLPRWVGQRNWGMERGVSINFCGFMRGKSLC